MHLKLEKNTTKCIIEDVDIQNIVFYTKGGKINASSVERTEGEGFSGQVCLKRQRGQTR
ncbi:hypothetical protein TTE2337 [Caldanaerobacter subterraneus subsp. tengcongensis MB4]|uniref:Uncharacterized protein n=1 Tax=Caldanaerobacter subterraneus subsp. tengcongensis (strain DSM 15242 / JCM 11007 / NBRC 100824 / MB4) TaxID=273068 RepID=Q8R7R1_CALS4|nr:hypothetical protein TTE2337 [Caldanaerobacter subterraneus subsp. tengcongensis MB4]